LTGEYSRPYDRGVFLPVSASQLISDRSWDSHVRGVVMIENRLKAVVGALRHRSFNILLDSGLSPNQITCIGLALVMCNCAFYLICRDTFFLGLGLALSFTADGLDGAVARRLGKTTKFGGYLDAVVDRYQEILSYFVLATVNSWWLPVFLLTTGAMMVSYNKAAVAIEIPIEDKAWPDLLERPQRTAIFCAALILDRVVYVPDAFGGHLILIVLYYLAALTHFTALQRFLRARRRLVAHDLAGIRDSALTP
jgi:phosphatidylglycerophosphate synthase